MAVSKMLREAHIESVTYPTVRMPAAKFKAIARPVIYADIHPGVYKSFVACWALLFVVFIDTFAESPFTLFMLGVCIFYATMFFGVPYVMSRVAPPSTTVAQVSFGEFLRGKVDTLTGPLSSKEALMQVIIVPLSLAIGGLAIGYIAHLEAGYIKYFHAF